MEQSAAERSVSEHCVTEPSFLERFLERLFKRSTRLGTAVSSSAPVALSRGSKRCFERFWGSEQGLEQPLMRVGYPAEAEQVLRAPWHETKSKIFETGMTGNRLQDQIGDREKTPELALPNRDQER